MLYSGEGVLPHPRPRFPRGGACVCAGVRALACACMGYPARARVCVLLSVGKQGKATGKPCDCLRLRERRWRALCLPFFVVLSAYALHLSAYGYLMAIHLLTYGICDAMRYSLAIQLLSSCYPIDLRSIALASLRSIATIGNVS